MLEAFNEEMKKFLDKQTFVQLSDDELKNYDGPINYITTTISLKDSATTPLRICTNSSFKNGKYSLNDLIPKGPNSLNDMLAVTIRFRSYPHAVAFDLSKAYNTMCTTSKEKHLRRFVWRWSENGPWLDFGIDKVHFGDRGAACQLEIGKNKTAKLGKDIDNKASEKLIQDTYVDDGATGGSEEEVQRMVDKMDEN